MIIDYQADTRAWVVIEATRWSCEEELSALILAFMSYNYEQEIDRYQR